MWTYREQIHCVVDHLKCTKWCCLNTGVINNIGLNMIWLKALVFDRKSVNLDTYFSKNSVDFV